MKTPLKALATAIAGGALLAGCATGPYYGDPAYGYGYGAGYGPATYDPGYYGSGYYGPSVGLGYTYIDRGDRREWRGDNRREWRGDEGRGRDWRDRRNESVPQAGRDYNNDYERQNLENRERLLDRGGTRDHGQNSPG